MLIFFSMVRLSATVMDTIEKIFDDAWMDLVDGHDIPYKNFKTPPKFGIFTREQVPAQGVVSPTAGLSGDGALRPPNISATNTPGMRMGPQPAALPPTAMIAPQQLAQVPQIKTASASGLTEAQKDILMAEYAKELAHKRMKKLMGFTYDQAKRRAGEAMLETEEPSAYCRFRNSMGAPKPLNAARYGYMTPKFQDPFAYRQDVVMQHLPQQQVAFQPTTQTPAYPTYSTAKPHQYPQWGLAQTAANNQAQSKAQAFDSEDEDKDVTNMMFYLALGSIALYAFVAQRK